MEYKPVLTKSQFVKLYQEDAFGNRSPTWNSASDWLLEYPNFDAVIADQNLYHIRNRVAGAKTWYNVKAMNVPMVWGVASEFYSEANLYISAMAPTEKTTLQGELMDTPQGLYLYYTKVKKPMRDALVESALEARGLEAIILLRHHMNHASYEWLNELRDRYPNHVIEFSCYSCCFGTVPGFNTLFWECRFY